MSEKADAERVAEAYFAAVRARDFDRVLDLYGPPFYERTSREEWRRSLEQLNARLGDLQGHQQTSWNVRTQAGTGAGTYYLLQYKSTYSKHAADETLTLFRPSGGGEIAIIGHNINSPGLLAE